MGGDKLSPAASEASAILREIQELGPSDKMRLLESDLSPKPVAIAENPLFPNKAPGLLRLDGRYLYSLYLFPGGFGRGQSVYLRSFKDPPNPLEGPTIDTVYSAMDIEANKLGSSLLRRGEFQLETNRIQETAYRKLSSWTDDLMEEMFEAHFHGFTIGIHRKT